MLFVACFLVLKLCYWFIFIQLKKFPFRFCSKRFFFKNRFFVKNRLLSKNVKDIVYFFCHCYTSMFRIAFTSVQVVRLYKMLFHTSPIFLNFKIQIFKIFIFLFSKKINHVQTRNLFLFFKNCYYFHCLLFIVF